MAEEKPNIVIIYTDDHGWPDIGAAGVYDDLVTPNIDALAASGVRATNGYSSAPQCVPSRGGLLSGKYQNRFGLEGNPDPLDGFNAELTIAERLKEVGYATGQIGKWHLGPANQITDHGFDDVYAKNNNAPGFANFTLSGETVEMQKLDDGMYHLDACSRAAEVFVDRHHEEPFFLYLAYRAPHVPLDAPPKYLSRFPGEMPERRRQALAMISAMDDGVGALVNKLEEYGLSERTLIFFIGDNGAPLKIHKHDAPGGGPGWDGSLNKPMNGEKGMLSEGGIRVPFVVSWPGVIEAEQVYDQPVITLDVAATVAKLAGLSGVEKLDGIDLIPHLTGAETVPARGPVFWRWISQAAVRDGKWKFLRGGEREYLFDLEKDPGELSNLAEENPQVAQRLRKQLSDWSSELKPPGLATSPMALTWTQYFDFYLEGKPAPPLKEKVVGGGDQSGMVDGWLLRNGSLSKVDSVLQAVPDKTERRQFLVRSGFKRPGPFTLKVRLKAPTDGTLAVSWRREGDKDFGAPVEGKSNSGSAGGGAREFVLPVTDEGQVIHLRILLPEGEVSKIESIEWINADGGRFREWRFVKP